MRKAKYPLESLRGVRAARVDDATASLAKAVVTREEAELAKAIAEAARQEHERLAAEKRASELCALEKGELTAADLARKDAWEYAVKADAARLSGEITRAQSEEDDARTTEEQARRELGLKKADADVVDKDKARFVENQNKQALATEEESAAEAWRPRRA